MDIAAPSLLLQVSPNPFGQVLVLTMLSTCRQNASVTIYNVDGQSTLKTILLLEEGETKTIIPTEDFTPGIYYLHYRTEISKLFIVMKLLKE